jgi:S1-C subfamily serine protease
VDPGGELVVALLSQLSDALADLVEATGQSVVRVEARRRFPASGAVWAADGLVVTADHTIEHEEHIRVGLADGRSLAATLVGRDPTTDIALLRVAAGALAPAAWGDPAAARTGHLALSLGRPGHAVRARWGVFSAVADNWRAPSGAEIGRYLEVDTGPSPGFSGGPVVNAAGDALGMRTSALLRGTSLVVPVTTLRRVVESLITYGRVRRGYLGIGAQPVRLPGRLRETLGQESGLLLVSVEPGGPAEASGLLLGDVILGFGGVTTHRLQDLMSLLGADRIGTTMPARILRGGAVRDVRLVVGERG